ncbi:MAG: hypothetical protein ACR2IK_02305 [Chloroflexota bacterium]
MAVDHAWHDREVRGVHHLSLAWRLTARVDAHDGVAFEHERGAADWFGAGTIDQRPTADSSRHAFIIAARPRIGN